MTFKKYLSEMPHIEWSPGKNIDLEIELYNESPELFLMKLHKMLDKKHHEDKYGGVLNIQNKNDLKSFIQSLRDNTTLMYWLENKGILDKFEDLINPYEI